MAIKRKRTFKSRIFISFFIAFSLFTVAILLFQYDREKKFKTKQLENTLDNISSFTNNFIVQNNLIELDALELIDSFKVLILDTHERLSIIDVTGKVLYDSSVEDVTLMENHLNRPEVQKALYSGIGSSIRHSATTNEDYYYYAKNYTDYFVRAAIIYDVTVEDFLKTESIFLIFIVVLFLLMWIFLNLMTRRLGQFVDELYVFSIKAAAGQEIDVTTDISDDELNTIRKQIIHIYNKLNKTKDDLTNEKEKLFQHMNTLQEGISFFTLNKKTILNNSHFIQYINMIAEKSSISGTNPFDLPELSQVVKFIDRYQHDKFTDELPQLEYTVSKNEYYFQIRAIIFTDSSFELLISDITKPERRRLLKQQLTANLTHELKTPVACIHEDLATMINDKLIPEQQRTYLIERSFAQSEQLSALLNDLSLLNSIEESGELFDMKPVVISQIVQECMASNQLKLTERNMTGKINIDESIVVQGNDSLLSSVFQNLIENSIKYAGENSELNITCYHSDKKYHYFSFADTGVGIGEEHIPRLFERFYRTDEGRSRGKGGTGLGLAIVKNAVILHKGEISVKNQTEGGLNFLFSLSRA